MDADTARAILAEPWDDTDDADVELPPLYIENEDGSKSPLPGVLSVFLTGAQQ